MNVTEEQWMAYVDGELDASGAARVEAAMRADPALAGRVAGQRRLRARLQRECAPALDEPVPARLRSALASRTQRRSRATVWLAAAASLVVGVLVATWWRSAAQPPLMLAGDGLAASGALAGALDHQLGAEAAPGHVVTSVSFRSRDGHYCRGFTLPAPALSGLACRRVDGWRIVALGAARAHGEGLRQASSALPPAVLAEIDARIAGEPLDAAGERRVRDAGWR